MIHHYISEFLWQLPQLLLDGVGHQAGGGDDDGARHSPLEEREPGHGGDRGHHLDPGGGRHYRDATPGAL